MCLSVCEYGWMDSFITLQRGKDIFIPFLFSKFVYKFDLYLVFQENSFQDSSVLTQMLVRVSLTAQYLHNQIFEQWSGCACRGLIDSHCKQISRVRRRRPDPPPQLIHIT